MLEKCEKIKENTFENGEKCVTIIGIGNMVSRAVKVNKWLEKEYHMDTESICKYIEESISE